MIKEIANTGSHVTVECDHEDFAKKRAGKCPECGLKIRPPFMPVAITFRVIDANTPEELRLLKSVKFSH